MDDRTMHSLGFAPGRETEAALRAVAALRRRGLGKAKIKQALRRVLRHPATYRDDPDLGELAALLPTPASTESSGGDDLRASPVPHRIWGRRLLDQACLDQFEVACRLPVAVAAAQMPDGHVGYGLPIGGVLATVGAVIPYAVGVDIACRMRLSIVGDGPDLLDRHRDTLRRALLGETRFGIGAAFERGAERQHPVLDDPAWDQLPLLFQLKERAREQLGTSGSGNHFVEFGRLTTAGIPELELPAGEYLALLSHSGSRGLGARCAEHFTKLAMARRRLPQAARQLAWLELDSDPGREYWLAMELAGRYAAANHELIHRHVLAAAGLHALAVIENHHNYAWREEYDGREVIVHRKGATPAGAGVLGVIPGSMADPGYVVRGRGEVTSLNSAAHGAGRTMSRTAARKSLTVAQRDRVLAAQGIELVAAGLDESPQCYKPMAEVMAAQADLVDTVAEFQPQLVLMARGGRAED